jgi:ABC-type uncharacterized transport system permease subunit
VRVPFGTVVSAAVTAGLLCRGVHPLEAVFWAVAAGVVAELAIGALKWLVNRGGLAKTGTGRYT